MVEYGSIWFNGIILVDIATDIELKGFTTLGVLPPYVGGLDP
jgi:hypothetical protein